MPMAPHEMSRSSTACHTARVRLSRNQKASTAPPKPQKCKDSRAPSYTVISTRYGSAIHVFLTYSNALSLSGIALAPLLLRPNAFADHPTKSVSRTASHSHLGAGTVLSRWSTIYKHTSLVSEPSWCDHCRHHRASQASQATQAPAAPLIRLSWTPAHCESAHTLIWNLRDPTATLRQHPARKPKRGALSLDAGELLTSRVE